MTTEKALKLALEALEMCEAPWTGTLDHNLTEAITAIKQALAAPVQDIFDHQQAASAGLRKAVNRSVAIAKNTVPTLQKRPQNCGTGYCSCIECVMEPAPVQESHKGLSDHLAQVTNGRVYVDPVTGDVGIGTPAATDLQAELDATNRQVEILNNALAESRREVDAMVALARADERESCAKVCDRMAARCNDIRAAALESAAENVRARGNT
jgi:hypothetical protein